MKERIADLIAEAVSGHISPVPEIEVEIPKVKSHGDFSTNIAILSARQALIPLPQLAQEIAEKIKAADREGLFAQVSATKTGFINLKINDAFLQKQLYRIINEDRSFGQSKAYAGKKVLIEFVSANPTGPLHIGHGRWAVIGDDIGSLFKAVGYEVEREYYVNDVGSQIEKLEASVRARAEGREVPEGGYGGAYINDIANRFKGVLSEPHFRKMLLEAMLEDHKRVLRELLVNFDRYFSEQSLHDSGKVRAMVEQLKATHKTFEEGGALWFKSQEFGDDKNRVLVRETGETTYFTADLAYHLDKFNRGYDLIINVWGTDHHGYVPRLKAALAALGLPVDKLEIIIGQLVALYRGAEPVRMSKRTGEMITLEEVIQEIGKDATRFFLTMVTVRSHLEFDLELAKQQAPQNPVYYVQYAYARLSSIFREAAERGIKYDKSADASLLTHEAERDLMRKLVDIEDRIKSAAARREPHLLVEYVRELAAIFHNYYHKCRVLSEDLPLSAARLLLAEATRIVIRNVLELLKIEAPERM